MTDGRADTDTDLDLDMDTDLDTDGDRAATAHPGPVADAAPDRPAPSPAWLDRFAEWAVDRLNPILVREVRQAVNGKGFVGTAGLALLATILIGLFAAAAGSELGRGASVFVGAMEVLAPIVLFIVPLQAFLSTRQEVTRGTVEHLLLSRLTPGQIVRGKLGAATVQFVMYVAIFSPLLAMTFLLRGVDVPTIAYSLLLALLTGLAASSFAVACGALSRWPHVFRVLPMVALLGGLIFLTVGAMIFAVEFLFEFTRELMRGEFWILLTGTLLPTVGTIVLCGLVGSAALSHPYENRSTGFRLFALVLLLGIFAWMVFVIGPAVMYLGRTSTELWYTSAALAGILALFALFASTEAPKLTPRVATRVPKNPFLRILSVPFLPGAGRGLLFTLLLAAIALVTPLALERWGGYGPPSDEAPGIAILAWAYIILYSGIGAFVRARMGPGQKANWIARGVPVGVLFLAILLPLLAEVILGSRSIGDWELYRILDPFSTFDAHDGRPNDPESVLGIFLSMTAIVLVLNLVLMWDGVTEVTGAHKKRAWRRR